MSFKKIDYSIMSISVFSFSKRIKSSIALRICFALGLFLLTIDGFAQYQAGDTIQIKALEYRTDTIEAEWNASNETPIEGKNVPMELDGRIVIGNPKTGSILSYRINVGAGGGTFVLGIEYKGFSGLPAEGYIYLSIDDGEQEKIWLRTEGWNTATSKAFFLSPGFHTLFTQYKGSSGSFNIDKFTLDAVPGTLEEKKIRQLSALTYSPETFEIENFDQSLSSITPGKFISGGENPSYITHVQNHDSLCFPFRVGAGGGLFHFSYTYKKLTNDTSSIQLSLDGSILETIPLRTTESAAGESIEANAPFSFSPGYHEIKIVYHGSDTHHADYFVLKPVENSLLNAHPNIFVNAQEKELILDKIAQHQWAENIFEQMKNNVSNQVATHLDDPEAILNSIPVFGKEVTHSVLQLGLEAGIYYFLTSDERYARFSADILWYYCKKLSDKTPQTTEILGDAFADGRQSYPYIALIYDFMYGYIKNPSTTCYDMDLKSRVPFDNERAQKTMINMAGNILQEYGAPDTHGRSVSNHPILTAPGALYPILCVEDETEKERLFRVFWEIGTKHQASFTKTILPHFSSQGIWPESVSYSFMPYVPMILNIVDRLKPELNVAHNYKHILEGSFIFPNLKNPNGSYIRFGDSKRLNESSDEFYRFILHMAERNNYSELKEQAEITLKQYYNSIGGYSPNPNYSIYSHGKSLELFWGMQIPDSVEGKVDFKPTVIVEHAGVALQRNYVEQNNELYGLNGYIGGAHYVHSHCTGIAMELYGAGYVMAPNAGLPPSVAERQIPLHTDYFRLYAGNNTVIVNGSSHGRQPGSWNSESYLWQNTTQNIASEPKHLEDPISPEFNFATQMLKDEVNNCDQQRTLSIIRTSESTGYYFDVFRSKSLDENKFHDYIYHNLGDKSNISNSQGEAYPLTPTDRYDNDINDPVHSPGWRYFENEKVSAPTSDEVKIRFDIEYDKRYMHMLVPGGIKREYTQALAPPTREAINEYKKKKTQVLAIRQQGEAWNRPFIAILEPSIQANSSVQSTEQLLVDNVVVGAKVISKVDKRLITDYVISLASPDSITLKKYNITFKGRFAVVRTVELSETHEDLTLYIGDGTRLEYGASSLSTNETKGIQSFANVEKTEQQWFYSLTLTTNQNEGFIRHTPEQADYLAGTSVELTAEAESGYAFLSWSGDVAETNNPLQITMDSNLNIVAEFTPVYTLIVNTENGSVSRSPNQEYYMMGTEVSLTPTADETYLFSHWSGDATGNKNPLIVKMDSNIILSANFILETAVNEPKSNFVSVYPNPSTGKFKITCQGNEKCSYTLFNFSGAKVQSGRFVENMEIKGIKQGTYIIRIKCDQHIVSFKLVVV